MFGFSLYMLRRRQSPRWQGPTNPGLVPLGQFRCNILFYLLRVATRVDRIRRNTQPVDPDVTRSGAVVVGRNEYYLIFTLIEVISDDEVMTITLQRATCLRDKQRRICLKLIISWILATKLRRCVDRLNLE